MDMKPILEITQKVTFGYGAKIIADDLGHSTQYLGKIVNPDAEPDEKKHLPLESFLRIMRITCDYSPLEEIARQCGYELTLTTVTPDKPTAAQEAMQDTHCLGNMQEAINNGCPPEDIWRLANTAITEVRETATKYSEEYANANR